MSAAPSRDGLQRVHASSVPVSFGLQRLRVCKGLQRGHRDPASVTNCDHSSSSNDSRYDSRYDGSRYPVLVPMLAFNRTFFPVVRPFCITVNRIVVFDEAPRRVQSTSSAQNYQVAVFDEAPLKPQKTPFQV